MIPPAVVGIVVLTAAALGTTGLAAWASGRNSPRVARSWRSAAKELGLADDVVRIGWWGIELAAAEDQLSRETRSWARLLRSRQAVAGEGAAPGSGRVSPHAEAAVTGMAVAPGGRLW